MSVIKYTEDNIYVYGMIAVTWFEASTNQRLLRLISGHASFRIFDSTVYFPHSAFYPVPHSTTISE